MRATASGAVTQGQVDSRIRNDVPTLATARTEAVPQSGARLLSGRRAGPHRCGALVRYRRNGPDRPDRLLRWVCLSASDHKHGLLRDIVDQFQGAREIAPGGRHTKAMDFSARDARQV